MTIIKNSKARYIISLFLYLKFISYGIQNNYLYYLQKLYLLGSCFTKHYDVALKNAVKKELTRHGITHITLELEESEEHCNEKRCEIKNQLAIVTTTIIKHLQF